MDEIKEFAWQQMDGMWHDGSGLAVNSMVKFEFKGYWVVNPWMDEETKHAVNPYKYYGVSRTKKFINAATAVLSRYKKMDERRKRA